MHYGGGGHDECCFMSFLLSPCPLCEFAKSTLPSYQGHIIKLPSSFCQMHIIQVTKSISNLSCGHVTSCSKLAKGTKECKNVITTFIVFCFWKEFNNPKAYLVRKHNAQEKVTQGRSFKHWITCDKLKYREFVAYSNSLYLEVEMYLAMWTQQLGGLDLMIWQNEFGEYANSTCQSSQPNQWYLHFLL